MEFCDILAIMNTIMLIAFILQYVDDRNKIVSLLQRLHNKMKRLDEENNRG
jgi:hypothetical protein